MTMRPTMLRPVPPRAGWQVGVGLVLALPAFVLLLTSYVEPLYWTVTSSFRKFSGIRLEDRGPGAGGDNYSKAFDNGLGDALGFALSLAAVPLLLVLVLAPALAWAAHLGGRTARWVVRGLLAIPIAAFAPMAIALAHRAEAFGDESIPDSGTVRMSYWLGTFGLIMALAVTAYLAALRRRIPDSTRSPWPALAIVAVLAVFAVLAAALQEFTYPFVAGAGTGRGGETPAIMMYLLSFRNFTFGLGAAISMTMLLPLIVLGALASVLVIVTGTRLEVDPRSPADVPDSSGRSVIAWAAAGVLLLIVAIATWSGLGPWLSHITGGPDGAPSTWANTWVPPLIGTIVAVLAAALAAFGISGLRPLGRHSEWLLLPFGLFLFVGSAPLALRSYAGAMTADRLNSFVGLIPPSRIAIPAMFILALLFRGQALRRETLLQEGRPAPWSAVIVPALPMLGLTFVATWLVHVQDLIWPLISAAGNHPTAQYVLMTGFFQTAGTDLPYGRLLPLWLLIVLILGAIAAQLLYLDRVALRAGLPERDHPPRT